jgi:two-component SAPR family response regulator
MAGAKFVLIIDDDTINNFVCSRIIKLSGLSERVECVLSADEGMDILEKNLSNPDELPDLIFLDINMPGKNGWDFLDKFKNLKPSLPKRVLVFMLSSSLYREDVEHSKSYNEVTDYITKPLAVERLKELGEKYFSA